jgi:hypothetical protein
MVKTKNLNIKQYDEVINRTVVLMLVFMNVFFSGPEFNL